MRARFLLAILGASLVTSACGGLVGPVEGNKVVAYFSDVGDLVERGTVQIQDVKVGLITDISLVIEDGHMLARVEMTIKDDVNVPRDGLEAIARQTSLLGEQFIELLPTTEGPPFLDDEGTTIPLAATGKRVDVETFLSDVAGLIGGGGLEDLNRFTHAQALILQGRGERFGDTLEELEKFTAVLAARRGDIAAAIDSLGSASQTIDANQSTLNSFLDSLEAASALLAEQGDRLGPLFASLNRFGEVNARFLTKHQSAINRQFVALEPILSALASNEDVLRSDLKKLTKFFALFPKSFGGGPGSTGEGDYIQADAVLCEILASCHTGGERGDVPGEGS